MKQLSKSVEEIIVALIGSDYSNRKIFKRLGVSQPAVIKAQKHRSVVPKPQRS